MNTNKKFTFIIDLLVPFGKFIRENENITPFSKINSVLLFIIPRTFFFYWLSSFIPILGTLFYSLILIPLSIYIHVKKKSNKSNIEDIALLYYVIILIGFGGIWNFIGHTFMADTVAAKIGWEIGSPFQTELAFFTLGTAVAGIMAIWLRGHMITALIISKSIFLLGAAYVHIKDMVVHNNYSTYNTGTVLIGDIIFPILFLFLLYHSLKNTFNVESVKN
jgi:hypothetical protein